MSSHETIKSIQLLSDNFNLSPETELNYLSQFLVSQTEGKRYHDTKEMFDSAYDNYRLCQSLFDFIQLLFINTTKEPKRSLNNKCDLTNNSIRVKKKRLFGL